MAYLSLYRKYRSQSFEEVAGQEHVVRTLQNALRTGRVAHAYLFCGPRGTGKTSTARLLAKALNCAGGPTPAPCGRCDACLQIAEGRFLDLREIDAASNRGIDEIRALRETVAYASSGGRYKVYVIDEAHQITGDGFNALLKTLEEPPPHVLFVLATTEAHKIPATIVSRCQRFEFRRASLEQLRERVAAVAAQEGAEIEPAALDLIAREANGGWRDALSLLEQVLAFAGERVTAHDVYAVLGTVEADTLFAIAEAVRQGDGAELFRSLEMLISEGKDPRQLLRDLTAHYRVLMLTAAGCPPPAPPEEAERLAEQARACGRLPLIRAIEILAEAEREARWSEQPRLLLELALVRIMHPARAEPAQEGRAEAAAVPRPQPPPARPQPARSRPAPSGPARRDDPWEDAPPPLSLGDARAGREPEDALELFGPAPAGGGGTGAGPGASAPRRPAPAAPPAVAPPAAAPPAAGAAPAAAAAADPAAAGAPHNIQLLRQRWRLVREELARDRKRTVEACLVDTLPARFEADVLVIQFPNRTMAEMFQNRGKSFSDPLSAAIRRVTGIECRVRPEAGASPPSAGEAPADGDRQPEGGPPPDGPRFPARPAATPAALIGGELVHDVLDIFDGRIVDDAGLDGAP